MLNRLARKLDFWKHSRLAKWLLPVRPRADAQHLGGRNGTSYGRYLVPVSLLAAGDVAYCAGIGEDLSFETALASEHRMLVYALDPTPRSIEYATPLVRDVPGLRFLPIGLWSIDTVLRFAQGDRADQVSYSAIDTNQGVKFFDATCKRIDTLMREEGHTRIALLKMNIEGAEVEVLNSMLDAQIYPRIIVAEMDHPSFHRTLSTSRRLLAAGYTLIAIDGRDYTFVRES